VSSKKIDGVMGSRVLVMQTHWFILKLDIGKSKWLNNLPMSGENGAHMKHVKIPPKKKPIVHHKPPKASKNLSLI